MQVDALPEENENVQIENHIVENTTMVSTAYSLLL